MADEWGWAGALDEDKVKDGGRRGAGGMMLRILFAVFRCGMPDGRVGSWRRSAVLPVAVGHGILSLLLLEELCDGQQLFQHMLHRKNAS